MLFDYFPCEKQECCSRVLEFFPLNIFFLQDFAYFFILHLFNFKVNHPPGESGAVATYLSRQSVEFRFDFGEVVDPVFSNWVTFIQKCHA